MKVLIVDDEAYAVNALTNRIDWNGFGFGTPFSARSMAQAQSVFLNEKIDLLLCDIEMPQGSGLDLFEWVKAYYPQTECIFVTCHDEYSYLRSAMQLGSCDYILKPVDYDQLKETLKEIVQRIARREQAASRQRTMIPCLFMRLAHHPTTRISPALLPTFQFI